MFVHPALPLLITEYGTPVRLVLPRVEGFNSNHVAHAIQGPLKGRNLGVDTWLW